MVEKPGAFVLICDHVSESMKEVIEKANPAITMSTKIRSQVCGGYIKTTARDTNMLAVVWTRH